MNINFFKPLVHKCRATTEELRERLFRSRNNAKSMDSRSYTIDETWSEVEGGQCKSVKVPYGNTTLSMLVVYAAEQGHLFAPHYHAFEEIVTVMGGPVRFTTAKESVILEHGDQYRIPANRAHYAEWLGDATLSIVFSPSPKDLKWVANFIEDPCKPDIIETSDELQKAPIPPETFQETVEAKPA